MWQYESSKRFPSYHPENELIFCHQLVITALKIKRKKVEGHNPQKAHLHPLRDMCMQYENNQAHAF